MSITKMLTCQLCEFPGKQVVNYMAAQTVLLNQDRCTKNFYIYYDNSTSQWSMLAWDVESALTSDRGALS